MAIELVLSICGKALRATVSRLPSPSDCKTMQIGVSVKVDLSPLDSTDFRKRLSLDFERAFRAVVKVDGEELPGVYTMNLTEQTLEGAFSLRPSQLLSLEETTSATVAS